MPNSLFTLRFSPFIIGGMRLQASQQWEQQELTRAVCRHVTDGGCTLKRRTDNGHEGRL
jgi:hypothetical protein